MSIKVGVRVRPFNKRQQQLHSRRCIQMQGNTTNIIDGFGNSKPFVYDYSFWSHDKFSIDSEGVYIPDDQKYADQRKVFNQIGSSILINAWEGYNCCLFAYGQTGSGKSYSMIGYGPNKGIIPIVCEEIFNKIHENKEPNKSFEVTISMMEIYNETIKDLLSNKPNTDLRICEKKNVGVFVEGLRQCKVQSYSQIQSKIQEGSNNRSIAATLMNESSSRSHTIVSLKFQQKIQITNSQMNLKYSVIHLVDLAGSESVGKTGAITKDRLRETAKINQSLSTLGRVIQTLADNAGKTQNKLHVPYRDSKLTFILRNALGGNSQTAMICAISPADDNYQETLSTLRYAQRAKKIQNKAIINESDVDKLVRTLRQENQNLKNLLREAQAKLKLMDPQSINTLQYETPQMMSMGYEVEDDLQNQEQQIIQIERKKEIQKQQKQNQKQHFEKKLDIQKQDRKIVGNILNMVIQNQPYITNISEDEQLSLRVKYSCRDLTIGNKAGEPKPDVILAALGIFPRHARIFIENNQVFLQPLMEAASEYLFVNGDSVSGKVKLYNLDRVIFGTGCIFLVKIAEQQPKKPINQHEIDYQFAIGQIQLGGTTKSIIQQGQIRKQIIQQYQIQHLKIKQQNEQIRKRELEQQQKEYQKKLNQIQAIKNNEASTLRRELQTKEAEAKILEEEKQRATEQVLKYLVLEEQLKKQKQQQSAYQETVVILEQKMRKVRELQEKLAGVNLKQQEMKKQILLNQSKIRGQMEVQRIIKNNQNILKDYNLEYNKKMKSAKQLRQLFVKKQKMQLQKKLIMLVPMVEKFNLIAKQLIKKVQCGLSVQYRYVSQTEIAETLKTQTYNSKFSIIIHVINKEEKRSYYWPLQVFQNRFQLAVQLFDAHITSNKQQSRNIDKNSDPYWDPIDYSLIGMSFLMIQCIVYSVSFKGKLQIIGKRKNVGNLSFQIKPCDSEGVVICKQNSIQLHNPRQLLQKTLYFSLSITEVQINKDYQKIVIEYELPETNFKFTKFKTEENEASKLSYQAIHKIQDLTEDTLLYLMERPIVISVKAWPNENEMEDSLTQRSCDSSFASEQLGLVEQDIPFQLHDINDDINISPPKKDNRAVGKIGAVFDNNEVLGKIERDFQKKTVTQRKKEKQLQWIKNKNKVEFLKKQKQCLIF